MSPFCPEKGTHSINLVSEMDSTKTSLSEPSATKETTFANEHHSDDAKSLIEKSDIIRESSLLLKMKPHRSHLPFKKRFIFEDYLPSSNKEITLKKITSGLITPSPPGKYSSSHLNPFSLNKITFSQGTLALASNALSHPSLRSKIRSRRVPFDKKKFPPIRKIHSSHLETLPSEKSLLFRFMKQD